MTFSPSSKKFVLEFPRAQELLEMRLIEVESKRDYLNLYSEYTKYNSRRKKKLCLL